MLKISFERKHILQLKKSFVPKSYSNLLVWIGLIKKNWDLKLDRYTKNFGKYPVKHLQFPFNEIAGLQSTAYWTKTSITDTFVEVHRRERMFWNFENSKKPLQNCLFFSNATGLQFRIYSFKKSNSKKKVFWNSLK